MTDEQLLERYVTGRRLPDGRLAGVHDRGATAALHVGIGGLFGTSWTYDKHW